jgi:hypothetical protein
MTRTMKRLAAVGLIASAALGTQTAHAVSASTTIEIDFPTILVLYHYDTINMLVDAADLGTALAAGGTASCTASGPGEYCVELTGPVGLAWDMVSPVDAGMDVDPGTSTLTPGNVNVVIQNAWGVRSVGAASMSAGVTGPANLTDGTNNLGVSMTPPGTDNATPTPGLALDTGSIEFGVDLTNLNASGTYSGDFTITVTSP